MSVIRTVRTLTVEDEGYNPEVVMYEVTITTTTEVKYLASVAQINAEIASVTTEQEACDVRYAARIADAQARKDELLAADA